MRASIGVGVSNNVYTDTTGSCSAFGSQNTLGTGSDGVKRSTVIGYFNRCYKDDTQLIGRNIEANSSTTANGSATTSTSSNMVIVGMYNDKDNANYNYGRNIPATFVVGAGSAGQTSLRKNAIVVTKKGTVYNVPNVGNVSNVESCVIMPEVGEHHNYGSDCAAAQAGIPLYGLYHTAGVLKIRIGECGSGNPPTTTTSTSRSNPGSTGLRWLVERCDGLQYYIDATIYCNSGNTAIIPGGNFSQGDIAQFQLSTNCSGATYCGELLSQSTGAFTGRFSNSGTSPSCSSGFCFE